MPILALLFFLLGTAVSAFGQPASRPAPTPYEVPDVAGLLSGRGDSLRELTERFEADRGSLSRFYDQRGSVTAVAAMRQFYSSWLTGLERLNFKALEPDARIDFILFRNVLRRELRELDNVRSRREEIASLLPFADAITGLRESRQRGESIDGPAGAKALIQIARQADEMAERVRTGAAPTLKRTAANRAARTVEELRQSLRQWFEFYSGYDPVLTWWATEPWKKADKSLLEYGSLVRQRLANLKEGDRDTILGDPIGRAALIGELDSEMIPYTPEQLLVIAKKEFDWCRAEMLKASRDLGYGDDWQKALEHVKNLYVPPGQQPALILKQAVEAIDYVEEHGLVTVPALARDTWRMQMMSPERQRINPFFTGGEVISVSYPVESMSHEQKLMSMRGNNIHFSRATVFHELIPGHHLQQFMTNRYRRYRSLFRTPFWGEGWALHWELLFWEMGFQKSPENRIGMLFWRSHRAARIIFSLSFHLEKMTAQECVDFLVNEVGHERENATAEVRRSFEGFDGPLYQAAYLLGALQFRSLHQDLVKSGKMNNREFHDAILRLNSIPVAMVRASLLRQAITPDFKNDWKFYGEVNATQ